MTKTQKIWLWIFIAMFALPEILFLTTPALLMSISGKSFSGISSLIINYKFFLDHPLYLLFIIAIEWIGALGIFVFNINFNKNLLAVLFGIILMWLLFVFGIVYITGFSMNF